MKSHKRTFFLEYCLSKFHSLSFADRLFWRCLGYMRQCRKNEKLTAQTETIMFRPSQTESSYVQIFMRSPDFRAFMSRLPCVHVQTFVRSCSDFRACMFRFSCVHQTSVRSCSDFRAFMFRVSCVHIQTFVRSCSDFCAFTRLS